MFASRSFSTKGSIVIAFVLLSLIGLWSSPVRAELASYDEAQQVADNFLTQMLTQKGSWAGVDQPVVSEMIEIRAGDTLVGWSFAIIPKGFVLVSALKEQNPIIAYSDRSDLDLSHEGGPLTMFQEMLGVRATLFASQYGSLDAIQPTTGEVLFDPAGRVAWDRLAQSSKDFKNSLLAAKLSTMAEAGPLATTLWHQSAPYNNECPPGDGGQTVVGCVATATAQVMAFWQWPPNGVGSYSYTWSGDNSCDGSTPSQVLTADFSDAYDWANIVNGCAGGCSPEEQAALAELNYEVGVSHSMDYGKCGSGAWTAGAANVLRDYFKYSPNINIAYRNQFTQQEWYDAMVVEIDANRVAQYRIRSHSIVMDGYRDNFGQLEYHMNYGWGDGGFNAWFVIDALYCSWVDGDVCPYDEEYMIRNIYPQDEPVLSYVSFGLNDAAGDGDGLAEAGEELTINVKIRNDGIEAVNATATISCADPLITILDGSVGFDPNIIWGDESDCLTPFKVQVDQSAPDPMWVTFDLTITADGGHLFAGSFVMFVGGQTGFDDDMEANTDYWSSRSIRSGYGDQWHLETYRKHSGTTSWKMGGAASANYADLSDAALLTPPFLLPANAAMTFWHFMDAETSWDGGIVMILTEAGDFEQIFPEGGYTHNIVDNAASPFAPETPCYSGSFGWTEASFDLSAYSGNLTQIMFRFGSDGAANEEGWYIDDISLFSTGCCGTFTAGLSGNTDCSADGACNLSDITRLIDRVYISQVELCCAENGNIDGDQAGSINLADITRLIDHVYISQDPTAACN